LSLGCHKVPFLKFCLQVVNDLLFFIGVERDGVCIGASAR
jgi:hypothetical protein